MPFDLDFRTFDFEEQAIRTVMRDGEPWFVAVDVCRVLELANTSQAVSRLDEDEKGIISNDTLGGPQQMLIISESGFYALVNRSDKLEAKRFRKWVTSVVLPSIRKTGSYVHPTIGVGTMDHLPGLDDMSSNNRVGWLNLIREARIMGGDAAGRRMWARSPLPPLDAEPGEFVNEYTGLTRFIADCCTVTGQGRDWIPTAELYEAYTAWARGTGQSVWADTTFFHRFSDLARHFICSATGKRFEKAKSSLAGYRGLVFKT